MKQVYPKFKVTRNGVTIDVYHADGGEGLPKHDHPYSHVTFCHSGSICIRKQNVMRVMTPDTQPVELKANEWHEIEALEPGTVFCNMF